MNTRNPSTFLMRCSRSNPRLTANSRVASPVMRHEYGDPRRGLSFEEMNFRSSLEGMGHELVAFDFMERGAREGMDAMRAELRSLAAETRPDLAFFILFTDQLDPDTVEAVGR